MFSLSLELAFGTEGLAKGVFLPTIYVIVFFLKWNKNIWRNEQSTMEQTVLWNHKHPKTIFFSRGVAFILLCLPQAMQVHVHAEQIVSIVIFFSTHR